MQKQEQIENYIINYKKHIFSKNIKITLKNEQSILVTMPYRCKFDTAKKFLLDNFEKIKSFKLNKKYLPKDLKTKFDTLKIIPSDVLKTKLEKKIVCFYYPSDLDFNCDIIQKALHEAYLKAIKIEAKNYLIYRTNFLAEKYNFEIKKIALKNQKTRFGSCSYCNNINLNIILMKYDFDIIDYVIIHELVHTKIKNHSKDFWLEVEKYCPDYKNLRNKLKTQDVY